MSMVTPPARLRKARQGKHSGQLGTLGLLELLSIHRLDAADITWGQDRFQMF